MVTEPWSPTEIGLPQKCGISCHTRVQGRLVLWLQMGPTFSLPMVGAETNLRFSKPLGSLDGVLIRSLVQVLVGISSSAD